MDKQTLSRLESLNQLDLTDAQEAEVLSFFADREADLGELEAIDTAAVERMVHVMPMENVLREDKVLQPFSREDLQAGAPAARDGYWQVPRTVN